MNKISVIVHSSYILFVKLVIIMVILVFFLVISVNRRLFRYFGSYSGISVIPVILVNRRTHFKGGNHSCGHSISCHTNEWYICVL